MFLYLERHELTIAAFLLGALAMFAFLTFLGLSLGARA